MSITVHFPGGRLVSETNGQNTLSEADLKTLETASGSVSIRVAMDKEELLNTLKNRYKPIQAGGGIVINELGQLLMIHRRGKWDLPKGKLDAGETIEECALREVQEETGATGLTLVEKALNTYHVYFGFGSWILKESTWFHMNGNSASPLVAQAIEDIEQCVWLNAREVSKRIAEAHQNLEPVLGAALKRMSEIGAGEAL